MNAEKTKDSILGRKFADAIGAPFADAFRYQYAISEKRLDLDEFDHLSCNRFHIYSCKQLQTTRLLSDDGRCFGVCLGMAITPDGQLLKDTHQTGINVESPPATQEIESFINALSGRYAVLVAFEQSGSSCARLYVDCIGSLGAIYDPSSRIVASTLLLALNRDIDPHPAFRPPESIFAVPQFSNLLPEPKVEKTLQTTCFGDSFDAKARQLLSNHFLDLNRFSAHRASSVTRLTETLTPEDAAEIVAERLKSNLAALQDAQSGYLAISGGLDSRMLVAAAPQGFSAQFKYYSYSDNWITGLDQRIAQSLCDATQEQAYLQNPPDTGNKSFFSRPRRSLYFQNRCAVASGLKTTGDVWWQKGYFRELDQGALWIRGNALEVVTARLWTPTVDAPLRKSLHHALRRLGFGNSDRDIYFDMRNRLIAWHDTLPDTAQPVFHDYWYQELFLSHSQANFYGLNEQFYFAPSSDHVLFDAARRVAPGLRRVNKLYEAILQTTRPELLNIPTTRDLTRQIKQSGLRAEETIQP